MVISPEFQAVVLAGGKGSRMTDLTHSKSKCLLPVGNVPMIYFPLKQLKKLGFKEVIVIIQESAKTEISTLAEKYNLDLTLDIHCLNANVEDYGTADALRLVHHKIVASSVLVVSSDLITDVSLHNLSDLHRIHHSTLTVLYAPDTDLKSVHIPGPKNKNKKERDIIGLDAFNHNQLCFLSSEADLEDLVNVRRSLLREHPRIKLQTNLTDAHMYIIDKWVLDFLYQNTSIATIKGELLPYLVKKQFNQKLSPAKINTEDEPTNMDNKTDLYSYLTNDEMILKTQSLSHWNDHSGDMSDVYHDRPLRCYASMAKEGLCYRVNDLRTYCHVNQTISQILSRVAPELPLINEKAQIQPKCQIGEECLVGESSILSGKTTIKNCIIGANCKIEEKVKLTDCVLMDGITIKEGCNIQGSLICDNVIVENRCEMKNCLVGKGQIVQGGGKRSNELIQENDRMMEV